MASLEVHGRHGAVRRQRRARRRQHRGRARLRHRAHRPERRGQDDAVQRHHRAAPAERGPGRARRPGHHPPEPDEAGPARAGPHVPAARAVQPAHRAREHPGRGRHPQGVRDGQGATRPPSSRRSSTGSGCSAVADERVDSLPTGQCRLVELGRSLATKPEGAAARRAGVRSGRGRRPSSSPAAAPSSPRRAWRSLLVEHDVQLVMTVCTVCTCSTSAAIIARGAADRDPAGRGRAGGLPRLGDERAVNLLELRDVRAAYDRIDVLFGVDLAVPEGQRRRAPRSERRGQDHDAAGLRRPAPAERRRRPGRRPAGQRRPPRGPGPRAGCA